MLGTKVLFILGLKTDVDRREVKNRVRFLADGIHCEWMGARWHWQAARLHTQPSWEGYDP